jgi:AraC-like DNA-binding protein/mannose-6-phosphate isomerase-like protein (cupin superfamily)
MTARTARSTNPEDYQRVARPVAAMPKDFPSGHHIGRHSHARGQLVYATRGVMRVGTDQGSWVVPPQRALWIPPGVEHEIRMSGAVAMRTLYIAPETATALPRTCQVIEVSDLLRALILAAIDEPVEYETGSRGEAIAQLLLHELRGVAVVPLHLPLPQDARLREICRRVSERLGSDTDIETLAREAGMSSRSLARLFQRETGMGFLAWRQQARLAEALAQLSTGKAIALVAQDLGYASPAAFTAMFRRSLGTTPGKYFRKPD